MQDDNEDAEKLGEDITDVENEKAKDQKFWKRIPGFGFFLIVVALTVQNFTSLLVKKTVGIDPLVLLFYRSIIILLVTLPWSIISEKSPFPPHQKNGDRLRVLYRGVVSCLHQWAGYHALR